MTSNINASFSSNGFNGPQQWHLDVAAVRHDRFHMPLTGRNAQGMFSPAACLFVGNLSTRVPIPQLVIDLKARFSVFGRCHVKIKKNWKRQLSSAFLQYEEISAADGALASYFYGGVELHGRVLRIERAKGQRTVIFGYRDGTRASEVDVAHALAVFGSIETCCMDGVTFGWCYIPAIRVTYVYVADYQDAMSYYRNHPVFFMFEAEELPKFLSPYVPEPYVPEPRVLQPYIPKSFLAQVPEGSSTFVPAAFTKPLHDWPVVPTSRSVCGTPMPDGKPITRCQSAPLASVRSLWSVPEIPPIPKETSEHTVLRYPVKKGAKRYYMPSVEKLNGIATEQLAFEKHLAYTDAADENTEVGSASDVISENTLQGTPEDSSEIAGKSTIESTVKSTGESTSGSAATNESTGKGYRKCATAEDFMRATTTEQGSIGEAVSVSTDAMPNASNEDQERPDTPLALGVSHVLMTSIHTDSGYSSG